MKIPLLFFAAALLTSAVVFAQDLAPIPEIQRRIPPASDLEFPDAEEKKKLDHRLRKWADWAWEMDRAPFEADMAIFEKAARLAVRNHEFYDKKDFALVNQMLDRADARYAELNQEEPTASWRDERGLVVRGYRSSIDRSVQPYGLEIPEKLDLSKPVPLLVWLHGRGDKITDIHFIERCLTKSQALGGKVADQQDAIIVHPFGRHCVGFKHAGEIDVLEVIDAVKKEYPIDPDKIALAGFSMGGAGAWHIGAHYRDQFCAVHAGAGFAETAEYNKLTPDKFPPEPEQTLWKIYDVPNYTRNFLNGPVLAYSGETDKQKQAADVMEAALKTEGHDLRHLIGPGMGHKYDDDSVKEIWTWLNESWDAGRDPFPEKIELQTPTLRYGKMFWFTATGLEKHWHDSRVTATWDKAAQKISVTSSNLTAFRIDSPDEFNLGNHTLEIDGQTLAADDPGFPITSLTAQKTDGKWTWGEPDGSAKKPGRQGPIDDAFLEKFIVVPPDSESKNPLVQRWVTFEQAHFKNRWIELMRGKFDPRLSREIDSSQAAESNLNLWGDPASNQLIAEIVDQLPLKWTAETLEIGGQQYDAKTHVPTLIYPSPFGEDRVVVINSGLTFRESHDRTNSLQNPKLPDWAVINIETDPTGEAPGEVVATGFFDENWE